MSEYTIEQVEPDFLDVRRQEPVTVDAVRRRIAEPDAPVLVDFDHTLFAGNSTELFISSCRPSPVVAVIDFLVRGCLPWRLVPRGRGFRVRDYLCVVLIVVLTPWNVFRWRRSAPALFERHRATEISALFADVDRSRLTIISFGMAFVISGLVRGSEYESAGLLATPLLPRPSWFAGGKTAAAVEGVGAGGVARAVFVSDSLDDADLLGACRSGLLVPPQGERMLARERLYIPMRYTARVKLSPWYALDQFLLVDALVIAIAVSYDLTSLLHFGLIAPLLLLSVMSVYELGYFENDMVAARSEERPVLDPNVSRYREYPIRLQAWIWAAAFAAAGLGAAVLLGELGTDELLRAGIGWAVLLVVLRAVFFLYNRTRTERRMFVYPLLQALKYGAVFVVFVPTVLGVALVMSQIMGMWVVYVVYRLGGSKKALNRDVFGAVAFLIAAGLLGLASVLHGGVVEEDAGRESANRLCFVAALLWSLARVSKAPVTRGVRAGLAQRRRDRVVARPLVEQVG
ncbi:hypothetical protein [Trujillonella humicola]|uniref:hypothetical protein n=1 Tax=Trujillonella humicola TaxID=3383699 RepID=UPI003905AEFE